MQQQSEVVENLHIFFILSILFILPACRGRQVKKKHLNCYRKSMNPGTTSKYFSTTNTFFTRLAEGILRFRWLLLLLVFLLTIFAFYEMKTIRMNNSNEAFFVEGDLTLATYHRFHDTFGKASASHFWNFSCIDSPVRRGLSPG